MTSAVQSRQIIGPSFQLLSNWCSMGCAGCGIHVAAPETEVVRLDPASLANVKRNLRDVKDALGGMGFEYAMVEQSGGEPAHYPEVVEAIGEVFEDCVHKLITNGLPSRAVYEYSLGRREQVVVVLSVDHHELKYNCLRLGKRPTAQAAAIHQQVLANLDLFVRSGIPMVVSSILSRGNIEHYLGFVEWLEHTYPKQIQDGLLTPIPVSLVSFGNQQVGKLNPSNEQVDRLEEAICASGLLTVRRIHDWFLKDMLGHYRNKQRHFEQQESLSRIEASSSKAPCEIFRYMIPFNFQDQEILRPRSEALFEGFLCGVKALGNIGHRLETTDWSALPVFSGRPVNMRAGRRYYRLEQIPEYLTKRERIANAEELIQMGNDTGFFHDLRRGMCLLDDFDGVWWPFNMYLRGAVSEARLGEFWSLFRNRAFLAKMRKVRDAAINGTCLRS